MNFLELLKAGLTIIICLKVGSNSPKGIFPGALLPKKASEHFIGSITHQIETLSSKLKEYK